jgi:DNA replication protein DnaC
VKPINDVMKKTAGDFAKRMIRKQYPKLTNVEFDVEQVMIECPECGEKEIPSFEIKRESDQHFIPLPVKSDPKPCVKCQDRKLAKEAVEQHKRLKSEKMTSQFWEIPPELQNETLATYKPEDQEQTEALATAVKYYKDFKSGDRYNLLFRGTYGGGKSHLLKGIADMIKKMTRKDQDGDEIPFTVGFLQFETLLGMVKGTWGRREGQTEHDIMKAVIDLDFLVIDDLGTESGEWVGKKMNEIINGRQGKATAYSTNFMDMDELAKRFDMNGGKIVSRLHSNTKIVDVITKDMRIEKQRG